MNDLKLSGIDLEGMRQPPANNVPRHRPGQEFLKGPVPWDWLKRAMGLPAKALHVALLLWKQAGCKRKRVIRFCLSHAGEAGISRDAARRAVLALEGARLVKIERPAGRCLKVTLLDTEFKNKE